MINIEISRFNSNDLDKVIKFLEYAITDTFNKEGIGHLADIIKDEVASKNKYIQKDMDTKGAELFFLIAKENDKIVGTIEYSPLSQLIIENTKGEFNGLCKVGTIYVHPKMQRMGMGSKMLVAMMKELKKRNVHKYCLDTGYTSAHTVWSKMFGEPLYTLKDYWDAGQHHSIWHLSVENTLKLLGK